MSTSSATCDSRDALTLAGRSQEFLQSLLDSNQPALGVSAGVRQGGVPITLKDEQRRNVGAEVIDECTLRPEHWAHACIWAADRFVVDREPVFHPSHVDRLGVDALGLQFLDEFQGARNVAGKGLAGLLRTAVIELDTLGTLRGGRRSRHLGECRVRRGIYLAAVLEDFTLRPALEGDGERERPLTLQTLPEVGLLKVRVERRAEMLTADAQRLGIIVGHKGLQFSICAVAYSSLGMNSNPSSLPAPTCLQ